MNKNLSFLQFITGLMFSQKVSMSTHCRRDVAYTHALQSLVSNWQ